MKKILIAVLTMGMILSLAACGENSASQMSAQVETGESKTGVSSSIVPEKEKKTETAPSDKKTVETDKEEVIETSQIEEKNPVNENDLAGILEETEQDFKDTAELLSAGAEAVLADLGDGYLSFVENRSRLSDWYLMAEAESAALYERAEENAMFYYKCIVDTVNMEEFDDWDKALDDFYDVWDEGMSDYYDTWDDAFDELYKKWDSAIEDAPDSVDYSETSDLWSATYDEHSNAWSAMYDAHSDSWSDIYGKHSAVWSGFYDGNTDVDQIINDYLAEQENQETEEEKDKEKKEDETKTEEKSEPAETEKKETGESESAEAAGSSEEYPDVTVVSDEQIILGPGNEYMVITNIDFSDCEWNDHYFSGNIYYTSNTKQAYVDNFSDYLFRQIVFGLYYADGNLRGEEYVQNNYIYDREYIWDDWTYVMISANAEIADVRVEKIIIEKPKEN